MRGMPKAQHATRYRRLPPLLRQLRADAGLTQRDLALKLGISHVAVHKSENGDRRVDVAEFVDWSIACGFDPHEALRRFTGERGRRTA